VQSEPIMGTKYDGLEPNLVGSIVGLALYLALLPRLPVRRNVPDAGNALEVGTLAPPRTSGRSSTPFTTKENSVLGVCSNLPSGRKAPLWCRRSSYYSQEYREEKA
jgi:hypothetical protein